jgi:hypothetical protein
MMKKIFFTVFLCTSFISTIFAQESLYGIIGGIEISNYSTCFYDEDGNEMEFNLSSKIGAKIGFIGEFAISKTFYIAPELVYVQRGCKETEGVDADGKTYRDYSEVLNYFQVPINALLKFNINRDSKFMIYAGPYLAYAFSGKSKDGDNTSNINFSSANGDYRRGDLGFNFGIGGQVDDWFLRVQYSIGCMNVINTPNFSYQKNRSVGIALGLLF